MILYSKSNKNKVLKGDDDRNCLTTFTLHLEMGFGLMTWTDYYERERHGIGGYQKTFIFLCFRMTKGYIDIPESNVIKNSKALLNVVKQINYKAN
jgi:hypothetical protein